MKKPILILFVIFISVVSSFSQKEALKESSEITFLEQFVGVWVGKGKIFCGTTTDEMTFSWLFNKRFLKMNYRTLEGCDDYTSEGFIWFNPRQKQFEYYDFNDKLWEIRQGFGKINGNSLFIDETRPEDRTYLELTFEFVDKNTLKVIEFYTQNKVRKLLADYIFKRKLPDSK